MSERKAYVTLTLDTSRFEAAMREAARGLETWGTLDPPDACMCTDCVLGDGPPDLDPRWEWVEAPRQMCDPTPRYVRGRCLHTEAVPVEAGGEVVAHLCLTCDAQLPEEWKR